MKIYPSCISPRAAFGVAAALATLFSPGPTFAQRLPTTVIPTHYTLKLAPDLEAATFSGEEAIDVNLSQPANSITLNAIEIAFQSVTILASGSEQTGTVSLDAGKQQATFTFSNTIPAVNATIKIRYTGILNDELRGFYLSRTARRNYAVTQFEATDARRAFPCFDEPAFKATFDISLVIDAGDTAISNSAIVADTPGPGAGKHTLVFGTTPKMSTYLVAFLVGDFKCTSGEPGRRRHARLRHARQGRPHPLRARASPSTPCTTTTTTSAFTTRSRSSTSSAFPTSRPAPWRTSAPSPSAKPICCIDPKTASIDAKRNVALVIAHEMAHQWFGDLVTMQWWDNIWLNEGFATWMENKPVAAMHPEWNIPQVVAGDEQDTLNIDAQPTTRAIRAKADTPDEIDQMFDGIAYGKASDVLLMVENYLGEETFRKGVHAYLAAHEYGNATAEDFWNAQTATSHKPVDKIMESLVAQPGEPILTFGAPADGKVSVEQKRFFLEPQHHARSRAEVDTAGMLQDRCGARTAKSVTPETASVTAPAAAPLLCQRRRQGYYRSAYAPAQYEDLVAHAESDLTPSERISLAGDEWAQVYANKATVGDYLDLVAALISDPSAQVFSNAAGKIGTITDKVASTKEERDQLAVWVQRNYAPEYAKLGPPAPVDSPNTRELRAQLLGLLADHGNNTDLQAQARKLADQYLDDPASVDPTLGQAALGAAVENGDAALFDRLQKLYETSADPELQESALRLLVQFDDPALLERALEYSVSKKVRNQDAAIQLAIGLQIPENRDATWSFIKTHWDQVHADLTTDLGAYLVRDTGNFCTAKARDDVKSFFAAHPVPASDVALKHAIENIDGCVELRRMQEPNLKTWLAANAHSPIPGL